MRYFALLLSVVLSACAATNPVVTATGATPENRPETVAFALHNSYVIVAEQAATLAERPDVPDVVKQRILALHDAASPVVKRLREAAVAYNQTKADFDEGQSTASAVAAALSALNTLITDAAPKIDAVASEIGKIEPPAEPPTE